MSLLDKASLIVTPNAVKASKLYSVIPVDGSGDMTVVRSTTATRINSSGLIESVAANVPRLDYTNGTCPTLLVEPQSTNLCTYSNTFNNATYVYQNASYYATPIVSPDGTSNGYGILANTSTNLPHRWYKTFVGLTGIKTTTIYANKGTSKFLGIGFNSNGSTGNNNIVVYNLENGTIATNPYSINATITSVGNGWYRCQHTFNFGTGGTTADLCVHNAGIYNTYTTSGFQVSDFPTATTILYIYGVQVESVGYPTSYIPTTTASVTRNADIISKTAISSLIGQTEGTIFIDVNLDTTKSDVDNRFIDVSDGVGTNWYFIGTNNSTELRFYFKATTAFVSKVLSFTTGRYKLAMAYANNDFVAYVNGTQVHSTSTLTVGATSKVSIGSEYAGINRGFVNTNSAQVYKTRLTNTELQSLTTL